MSREAAGVSTARQHETTIYRVIYHKFDEPAGTLRETWFSTKKEAQAFVGNLSDEAKVYGLNTEWVPSDPQELVAWLNRMSEVSPLTY